MLFCQYLDTEPVIATSYLLGCPTEGVGAVVNPIGDMGRYLKEAEEGNVPIRYVIDTHRHADHISNGRELAEAAGANQHKTGSRPRTSRHRSRQAARVRGASGRVISRCGPPAR